MAKDAPKRAVIPPSLRDGFDAGNSPAYARAAGSPAAVKALSVIERRYAATKSRMIAHHQKFEDRWTAREAMRIWKDQLAQNARYPAPKGEAREIMPDAVMRIAQRNIQARTNLRLSALNAVRSRMSNAVIRNLDLPKASREFKLAASTDQHRAEPTRTQRRTR